MKGPTVTTLKWPGTGRLRGLVLMLAVAGATAGGLLFTAAAAQAVTGTGPGQLVLHPASGATILTPTWSTTTACPVGYQASAVLYALNTNGSIGSSISPTVANVTSPFSGTLLGPVGKLLSLGTNVRNSGTSQWVVACSTGRGGLGKTTYVQSDRITLSADGKSYTSSPPSTSRTSGTTNSAQSTPWALIVLVLVIVVGGGLGGWLAWRWRRGRRDVALLAAAAQAREVIEHRMPRKPADPAAKRQGQG
jgi:hypothetical protein